MSASLAMASRCRTALVEPPVATTAEIAFSNALRVRIWRGVTPLRSRSITNDAGAIGGFVLARIGGRNVAQAHRREADKFQCHRHRVGRELAAARARARARDAFDFLEVGVASFFRRSARRPLRTHPESSRRVRENVLAGSSRRTEPGSADSGASGPSRCAGIVLSHPASAIIASNM